MQVLFACVAALRCSSAGPLAGRHGMSYGTLRQVCSAHCGCSACAALGGQLDTIDITWSIRSHCAHYSAATVAAAARWRSEPYRVTDTHTHTVSHCTVTAVHEIHDCCTWYTLQHSCNCLYVRVYAVSVQRGKQLLIRTVPFCIMHCCVCL